jgi:hypothetical protein
MTMRAHIPMNFPKKKRRSRNSSDPGGAARRRGSWHHGLVATLRSFLAFIIPRAAMQEMKRITVTTMRNRPASPTFPFR